MRSPTGQLQNMAKIVEMIQNAVSAGQPDTAEQLAGHNDLYLLSELVQSLYKQGYVSLAKERLMIMDPILRKKPAPPFLQLSYIWAEICYDEERYAEAGSIFEAIAEQNPDLASARFGAASCYLQEAIRNLQRRIQLYHPPKSEQEKISKYLEDLHHALGIIQAAGWHTRRTKEQVRNLPAQTESLLY